jgi:hypothetical protein
MSRTRGHKNSRHTRQGKDLWSKRPCSGSSYCKYNRKLTARTERAQERLELSKILLDKMLND